MLIRIADKSESLEISLHCWLNLDLKTHSTLIGQGVCQRRLLTETFAERISTENVLLGKSWPKSAKVDCFMLKDKFFFSFPTCYFTPTELQVLVSNFEFTVN